MDDSRPTTQDSGPGSSPPRHGHRLVIVPPIIFTGTICLDSHGPPCFQQATTTSSATTKNAPRPPYALLWLALKAIRPWHLPSTAYNLVQQNSLVLLSYFPRPSLRTTKPDAPSSGPTPTNRSCTPPSTWYTDIYDPVAHRQPGTVPLFSP